MKIMKKFTHLILAITTALLLSTSPSEAAIIVNIEEQGSDVVVSYSGSIDLTGIGFNIIGAANSNRIEAIGGQINFLNGAANKASMTDFGKNPWTVAPSAFGTGGAFNADGVSIAAGNAFGFQPNAFFIESTYVSGETISGSMTFNGQTLASMGINAGTGIVNATFSSGDTLTVNATAAAVPDSGSTIAYLVSCISVLSFVRRPSRS